jgi:thiamine kinase-like enzyme
MDVLALKLILNQFQVTIDNVDIQPLNQGYINDTFLVKNNGESKYILQRVNAKVFKKIDDLHQNFYKVLLKLKSNDYQEISLIPTHNNSLFYVQNENHWRLITYVDNSNAFNFTKDPEIAFEAGAILGKFHSLLHLKNQDDFVDIIENLNHLPSKINEFEFALANSSIKRKEVAKNFIDFALENKILFNAFYQANLPLRICHNDTKLNNMLFDKTSKRS